MARGSARAATVWSRLLDVLEGRLAAWQAALDGEGPYPEELAWPRGLDRCPAHLAGRARTILATQQDIQARFAVRHAAIGALLHKADAPQRRLSPALFVDQHS